MFSHLANVSHSKFGISIRINEWMETERWRQDWMRNLLRLHCFIANWAINGIGDFPKLVKVGPRSVFPIRLSLLPYFLLFDFWVTKLPLFPLKRSHTWRLELQPFVFRGSEETQFPLKVPCTFCPLVLGSQASGFPRHFWSSTFGIYSTWTRAPQRKGPWKIHWRLPDSFFISASQRKGNVKVATMLVQSKCTQITQM